MNKKSNRPEPTAARNGKIARLPYVIRMEVNHRLLAGQTGREIIAWLCSQQAVLERMREYPQLFRGAISNQNISHWRAGGYQEWLRNLNH